MKRALQLARQKAGGLPAWAGALLALALPARAQIALVSHNTCSAAATSCTTPSTNMTGSTLLVMYCDDSASATPTLTFSDSSSNTWNKLTIKQGNTNASQLAYAFNPTVTSNQTFTCSESGGAAFVSVFVQGFSGTLTTSAVFDAQSGAVGTTTCQPGSITPAQSGEVFVTGDGDDDSPSSITINGSFTITDQQGCTNECGAMAELVNAGSSAQNPTWTNASGAAVCVMAAFKPSGGGAAPAGVNKRRKLEKYGLSLRE